ncbi:MAG: hypothetical protein ACREN2_07950 [Candidatus Dormibacteria bacterium]
MIVILTVASIVAALLLFGTLARFLLLITNKLDSIGNGSQSSLAMITWGVRAIENETAVIPAEVPRLNQQLAAAAEGLGQIDQGLVAIAQGAAAQEAFK